MVVLDEIWIKILTYCYPVNINDQLKTFYLNNEDEFKS